MSLLRDVRSGFRSLIQNPGFTAAAVAMLALGIGVNATVFTVTDAVLFKGFHLVSRNDRLAYIHYGGCCVSYLDFEDYRAQAKSFQGMAIVHGVARVITDKSGFPERYDATEVSADTFSLVVVSAGTGDPSDVRTTPSAEMVAASPVGSELGGKPWDCDCGGS